MPSNEQSKQHRPKIPRRVPQANGSLTAKSRVRLRDGEIWMRAACTDVEEDEEEKEEEEEEEVEEEGEFEGKNGPMERS